MRLLVRRPLEAGQRELDPVLVRIGCELGPLFDCPD